METQKEKLVRNPWFIAIIVAIAPILLNHFYNVVINDIKERVLTEILDNPKKNSFDKTIWID